MDNSIAITCYKPSPPQEEELLLQGLNEVAFAKKQMPPMQSLGLYLKNIEGKTLGGLRALIIYGSLHIDMLWVAPSLRLHGWGTKLLKEAEDHAKKEGCAFVTLCTMDWEALNFYTHCGYLLELKREGYKNNSTMYLLKKTLH